VTHPLKSPRRAVSLRLKRIPTTCIICPMLLMHWADNEASNTVLHCRFHTNNTFLFAVSFLLVTCHEAYVLTLSEIGIDRGASPRQASMHTLFPSGVLIKPGTDYLLCFSMPFVHKSRLLTG